jgi:hypothetical protein
VFLDLEFKLYELLVIVFGFSKVAVELVFELLVVLLLDLEVRFVGQSNIFDDNIFSFFFSYI